MLCWLRLYFAARLLVVVGDPMATSPHGDDLSTGCLPRRLIFVALCFDSSMRESRIIAGDGQGCVNLWLCEALSPSCSSRPAGLAWFVNFWAFTVLHQTLGFYHFTLNLLSSVLLPF